MEKQTTIIGRTVKAEVKFGAKTKTTTVKIIDKVFDKMRTKYVVEDVELGSDTLGKVTVIEPENLISIP